MYGHGACATLSCDILAACAGTLFGRAFDNILTKMPTKIKADRL